MPIAQGGHEVRIKQEKMTKKAYYLIKIEYKTDIFCITIQSLAYFENKYYISASTLNHMFNKYLKTTPKTI